MHLQIAKQSPSVCLLRKRPSVIGDVSDEDPRCVHRGHCKFFVAASIGNEQVSSIKDNIIRYADYAITDQLVKSRISERFHVTRSKTVFVYT